MEVFAIPKRCFFSGIVSFLALVDYLSFHKIDIQISPLLLYALIMVTAVWGSLMNIAVFLRSLANVCDRKWLLVQILSLSLFDSIGSMHI